MAAFAERRVSQVVSMTLATNPDDLALIVQTYDEKIAAATLPGEAAKYQRAKDITEELVAFRASLVTIMGDPLL